MNSNTDLKTIGKTLQAANSVLLFPHNHPDADAIGSSVALCMTLRKMGKDAWVIIEEEMSGDLEFIDDGMCTTNREMITSPDVTVAVDCSDSGRFSRVKDAFERGSKKIAIDHHRIKSCSQDLYYIDPDAASTTELIYRLIKDMEWELTPAVAEALYTGLVTDTGSFQHSNTTPESHRIAADLIEAGADVNSVTTALYKNTDPKTVAVEANILGRIEYFAEGMAAMVSLSMEQLEECGARREHADHMIDHLIKIRGVEIAATLKEVGDGISVSMRSKTWANVEKIASSLGGGGHIKAAGCTLKMPLEEAYAIVRSRIEEALQEEERP